mgnify:CR=1 FL=1
MISLYFSWSINVEKKIIFKLEEFFQNKNKLKELVNDYSIILNELSNKNTSKYIADDLIKNIY